MGIIALKSIVTDIPYSLVSKESACNAGDLGLIPGSGRSPAEGNGNLLQYLCLENPIDRGAWQPIVHGVARFGHDIATKPPPPYWDKITRKSCCITVNLCMCVRLELRTGVYNWLFKSYALYWVSAIGQALYNIMRLEWWPRKLCQLSESRLQDG